MQEKQTKRGAPIGNKYGLKIKNHELRQKAYLQYCEHLSKVKSKKSWHFEYEGLLLSWESMEKYIKNEIEFDPIHKKIAEAKGFAY